MDNLEKLRQVQAQYKAEVDAVCENIAAKIQAEVDKQPEKPVEVLAGILVHEIAKCQVNVDRLTKVLNRLQQKAPVLYMPGN